VALRSPLGASLLVFVTATAAPAHFEQTPPADASPGAPGCPVAGRCRAGLSPADVFQLAEAFAAAHRNKDAQDLLAGLTTNRDPDIRAEARFRIGRLQETTGDLAGAVRSYSALLAEKPNAAAVRLQLAQVLANLGREDAARRQLRRAQATGLPDDVSRAVDRFQSGLLSRRRFGGSFTVGFAPDSNINRASSDQTVTVGSVPVDLSKDAQAQSGLGLTIGNQIFWRPPIGLRTNLLLGLSTNADLYRKSQFNDVSTTFSVGPEMLRGKSRWSPALVVGKRWFGDRPYSTSAGGTLGYLRSLDKRSQIQVDLSALHTRYQQNKSLTGDQYAVSARYETALTPRLFARVTTRVDRQDARDPAFATWTYGGELLASREIGRQVGYARVAYYHTVSDAAFRFPAAKRDDNFVEAGAGLVLRRVDVFGASPALRVTHTVNHSPVFFYDFHRTRFEFALTRDF
jgi:outer membrane protein